MDRVFEENAAAGPPPPPSPALLGYPQEGATPTEPGAWWFYMITEELRAAIVAAGIIPSATSTNQLAAAITDIADGAVSAGLTGYATEAWVNAQGFATQAFASNASNLSGGTVANARLPSAITISGAMTAGSFNVSSDARLKRNIRPITNARKRIKKLRGVLFERTDTNEVDAGVIAQEARDALAESVLEGDRLHVRVMPLIGLLVATVNELIAELEARP